MKGMLGDMVEIGVPALSDVQWLEWVLLTAVLSVCSYTSYTDLTRRTIGNRATYGLLGLGVIGQTVFWLLGHTEPARILFTIGGGLAVGMAMYQLGVWGAGDAKLYWACVVALPGTLCLEDRLFSFDGIVGGLAVNTLLLEFVLLSTWLGEGVKKEVKKEKRSIAGVAQAVSGGALRDLALVGGVSGLVLVLAGSVVRITLPIVPAVGLVVGACLGIGKLRGKMPVVILVAGGWLLGLYVVGATGTWWEFASLVGMSWLGFAIAQALLRAAEGVFRKTIGVGELRAGMIPTVSLATDRADGEGLSGAESDPAGELLIEKGLPLDAAGLAVLEAAMARGSLEKHWPVEIEGTIPCAPMLLGGVFVTVLLRGSPMNEITSALSALF